MDGTQRRETVLYTDTEKRTDKIERIPWGVRMMVNQLRKSHTPK